LIPAHKTADLMQNTAQGQSPPQRFAQRPRRKTPPKAACAGPLNLARRHLSELSFVRISAASGSVFEGRAAQSEAAPLRELAHLLLLRLIPHIESPAERRCFDRQFMCTEVFLTLRRTREQFHVWSLSNFQEMGYDHVRGR
jgi:hypothetical protein